MADTPKTPDAAALNSAMQIGIGAQYIKDFSFESPHAPQIFAPTQSQPDINLGVNINTRSIGENTYEVVLLLKLETKVDGKSAFIAELSYGGVFMIPKMAEEPLRAFLLVECPRILFPFARQILMTAVRDGGFPHVMISPIDFAALFQANKDNIGTQMAAGVA